MGFRTFIAGEVLTAQLINDFLMKQSIITCTAASRPAAPVDGMTIYQTDTKTLLTYDSAASVWGPLKGNIAPYVRYSGLSGGVGLLSPGQSGTSGTITTIIPPVSGRLFWQNSYQVRQTVAGTLSGHCELTLNGALGTLLTPDYAVQDSGGLMTAGYHDVAAGTSYAVAARAVTAASGGGTYAFENPGFTLGYGIALP